MKFSSVCPLLLASAAVAAPAPGTAKVELTVEQRDAFESTALNARAAGLTDTDILNFALTLEHLENTFYREALNKFSAENFTNAGYSPNLRFNLREVSADEQAHVSFLSSALGSAAVPPCKYAFGLSDVNTFMAIASILEGVGITAYLGAAHLISDGDYLTAAGSILTIESRHSAYIRDNQNPTESPFPYPFDVPLTPQQVYTLASGFITSCPKKANLGFTPSPSLSVVPGTPSPKKKGELVPLTVGKGAKATKGKTFAYFIGNLGYIPAGITIPKSGNGKKVTVTVPAGIAGQSYVVLSSAKAAKKVSDSNIIAGPAIVEVVPPYAAHGFPAGDGTVTV